MKKKNVFHLFPFLLDAYPWNVTTLKVASSLLYSLLTDLIPKSLLLQLEAGRNFETFIVEYFRHRAHFKH